MTLRIHRAERTDLLADTLAQLIAAPLDDPFADEVVVVPARGVERWLSQRLSHRLGTGPGGGDGVCAGMRFLSPHSLVALLLGKERDDPWDADRLVWPLLQTIDESLDEPWCVTLAAHLGHGLDGDEGLLRRNRRYSVARRLAGLFASYALQRPALVTDWREGRDSDGAGAGLAEDLLWQAELWRRLLGRVDAPPPDVRHADTLARLRSGGGDLDLPSRLSLFGHTRLPRTEVELLEALGAVRDVHLWLPQPSPELWDSLAGLGGPVRRSEDRASERVHHPLLASLGRDSRELVRTLDGAGDAAGPAGAAATPDTLLGWLQSDIRANRAPDSGLRAGRVHASSDHSVQVHACHGPARQVDVLREVLVGLLEDDPTLQPRDVLVMCPDIESYAPLVSAGFGLAEVVDDGHPAHQLRVRLADRAPGATNPLLAVAAGLVELTGSRATATEVLDLIATAPVRARFRLSDDDLARVMRWVGEAGVRWGLDADQRMPFAMDGFDDNTWRSGLDRILLGVAVSGDDNRHLGPAVPVDDVGGGDIGLAGRLAELVARLHSCLRTLAAADTVGAWMDGLRAGVASLTDVSGDDAWQVPQFERELARTTDTATGRGSSVPMRQSDVRALLRSRLSGRPTRANFRTGTLTVCTMVPMRSVPHRVVCLVGLDDGVFPRTGWVDGDDVLARDPLTGERDLRSEDRQLLLDAILAARETLVVTYTGANEHSGVRRPPAVPLGEILDALDRTASAPVRDAVLVRHPLQPYDVRNHQPGALVGDRPFSFDRATLDGATAAVGSRTPPPAFLPAPLAPAPVDDVNLADLKAFFLHPVRTFLRQRLDISIPLEGDEVKDAIPVDLDNLEAWSVGDRLLREVMAGQDPQAVLTAELLRGSLPPGELGRTALLDVAGKAQELYSRTAHLRTAEPRSLDVDIDLGDCRRLTGTVGGVHGHRLVSLSYSSLKARQRILSWIDLLALSVGHPDAHWVAHAVGKDRAGPKCATGGPLDHRAVGWLRTLVDLYDQGRQRPLPLPLATGCAFAERAALERSGVTPDAWKDPVRDAWEGFWVKGDKVAGERDDAWHVRVHGSAAPVSCLVDDGIHEFADAVWGPLVDREHGLERIGPL